MAKFAFVLSIAGLSILGLNMPHIVHAQETENALVRNTPVTLNTEGTTLYAALKMMFGQAKADFTIVDSLKTLPVTVRINQPFRIALNSVLKATGQPITYSVEQGIYQIIPAPEEKVAPVIERDLPPEQVTPQIFKPYLRILRPRNLNGEHIAALLGGTVIKWIDGYGGNSFGYAPTILGGSGMGGFGGNGGFGGVTQQGWGTGNYSPFSQDNNRLLR